MDNLFKLLEARIMEIDPAVTFVNPKHYTAFRLVKNFAEVHVRKSRIDIHIRNAAYNDPQNKVEKFPGSHKWTLSKSISLKSEDELDYVMDIIKRSYQDVL